MAMTKKEQAAFQAAIDRAELLAALRWTSPVEPDVPIPEKFGEYAEGWAFNTYSMIVTQAWTTTVSHGSGFAPKSSSYSRNASQGAQRLYSTQAKAIQAMRHELEIQAAKKLLECDQLLTKFS